MAGGQASAVDNEWQDVNAPSGEWQDVAAASGQTAIPVYSTTVTDQTPPGFWKRVADFTVNLPGNMLSDLRDYFTHGPEAARGLRMLGLYDQQRKGKLSDDDQKELDWLEAHAPQPAGFGNAIAENPMGAPLAAAGPDVVAGNLPAAAGDIVGGYGSQWLLHRIKQDPMAAARMGMDVAQFARNPARTILRPVAREIGRGLREGLAPETPPPAPAGPSSAEYYAAQPGGTAEPSQAYYGRQQPPPPAPPPQPPPATQQTPPSPPAAPAEAAASSTAAPAAEPTTVEALSKAINEELAKAPEARVEEIKTGARAARADRAQRWADYFEKQGKTVDDVRALDNREKWRFEAQKAGFDIPATGKATMSLRDAIAGELARRKAAAPNLPPVRPYPPPEGFFNPSAIQKLIDIQERRRAAAGR